MEVYKMNKKDYANPMADQTRDSVAFANAMIESLSAKKLESFLDAAVIKSAEKVIITGCGDSWLAGIATRPAFEALSDIDIEPLRNIEFTRYYNRKKITDKTIVFCVSISGQVSRVVEAARRANSCGAVTVAVTNDPESPVGKECKHVLALDMPALEKTPGVSSYTASVMALMQTAIRFGVVRGAISEAQAAACKKGIADYCNSYTGIMGKLEDQMFEIALKFKDLKAYDFVGEYQNFATAYFGAAKFVEAFGAFVTVDDSEDWCHIPYFMLQPESIGTSLVVSESDPSFGRMKEMLDAVVSLKRPAFIITDANPSLIPDGIEVVSVPKAEHHWVQPLFEHIPYDFLASYITLLNGIPMFRAGLSPWRDPDSIQRIRGSQVVNV